MSDTTFEVQTVAAFLDNMASNAPTPGGGTGAAIVAANGAALVQMMAELTIGKKKYADKQALMEAIRDEAKDARLELLKLANEDAAAFDQVSSAFRLPKATDEEKAARSEAIQTALKGACEVPRKVMEQCIAVIGFAKNAVMSGNKNAASDGAAGAEFCRSALKVASYNVKINLASIKDSTYVSEMNTRIDEMLYMCTAVANEIDSHVQEMWKAGA